MKPNTRLLLAAVTVGLIAILVAYKLKGAQTAAGVGLLAAALLAAALGIAALGTATPSKSFGGAESENEKLVRTAFENVCGKPFPSDTTVLEKYELDGYNSELKVGFEYQGPHHYVNLPFVGDKGKIIIPLPQDVNPWDPRTFSRVRLSDEDSITVRTNIPKAMYRVKKAQVNDAQKKLLAESKGIKLIVIPYTVTNQYRDVQLKQYVASRLQDAGLPYRPQTYLPVVAPPSNEMMEFEYHIDTAPEWEPENFKYPFEVPVSEWLILSLLADKPENPIRFRDGNVCYQWSNGLHRVQNVYAIKGTLETGLFDPISAPAAALARPVADKPRWEIIEKHVISKGKEDVTATPAAAAATATPTINQSRPLVFGVASTNRSDSQNWRARN